MNTATLVENSFDDLRPGCRNSSHLYRQQSFSGLEGVSFWKKELRCCVGGGNIRIFDFIGRRADARKVSFRNTLRWPIYIINVVDQTKLSCDIPQRRSTTVWKTYTIFRTTLTRTIRLHDQMFHLVSNHSLIICLYKLCDSIIKLSNKTLFVSFALWLTNMPRENSV